MRIEWIDYSLGFNSLIARMTFMKRDKELRINSCLFLPLVQMKRCQMNNPFCLNPREAIWVNIRPTIRSISHKSTVQNGNLIFLRKCIFSCARNTYRGTQSTRIQLLFEKTVAVQSTTGDVLEFWEYTIIDILGILGIIGFLDSLTFTPPSPPTVFVGAR